jgi:hypothetical protein
MQVLPGMLLALVVLAVLVVVLGCAPGLLMSWLQAVPAAGH